MDLYEELVHFYLTVVEGCAAIPQVPVLRSIDDEPWYAYPDFLALDFKERSIQIIEVSKATTPSFPKLAEKLKPDHRKNVEHYIRTKTLNGQLPDFSICWRFFVREANIERLRSQQDFRDYENSGGPARITALEKAFDEIRGQMP